MQHQCIPMLKLRIRQSAQADQGRTLASVEQVAVVTHDFI